MYLVFYTYEYQREIIGTEEGGPAVTMRDTLRWLHTAAVMFFRRRFCLFEGRALLLNARCQIQNGSAP